MKIVALGKVAKIDRTIAFEEECKTLPYVGLEHVEKETGHFIDGFVPTPLNMLATNFRFTPRHVLYGKLRPYLNKVVLPDFDGVCTTEILPILPDEDQLDRTFLWAVFLSPTFVTWASAQISGANLPRLDPKLLTEYKIPLPPLEEQQRIADLLARADRLRRLRRYARELSDTYLQSVFVEMFGEPDRNPRGWDLVNLGNMITFMTSGSRGWAEYYSDKGALFLRVQNVGANQLLLDDVAYVQPPDNVEGRRTRVQSGDLLLSATADIGRTGVIPDNFPEAYINQHLFLIRLRNINPVFVAGYFSTPSGKAQILRLDREGVKSGLNFDDAKGLIVFNPPQTEQEHFADIVQHYERLRAQQVEAERQAELLFQSLLALYMKVQ
jgi:type I restriction enzyme S subunit